MRTVALVGCGTWGRKILRDLRVLGVRVWVQDSSPDALAAATKAGADRAVTELPGLAEADAFVIATPASTHLDVIEAIAGFGKPIFCEKPFALDPIRARAVTEPIRERLFVMHVWRYHGGVRALRDLVACGELGAVSLLRSTRRNWTSPRQDVDSIWTLAPHDLSIFLEILGRLPRPQAAAMEFAAGRPTGMIGLLADDHGSQCVLDVSTRYGERHREVRVHCARGVARLADDQVDYLELLTGNDRQPVVERVAFDPTPPLLEELGTFIAFLDGGPRPVSTVDDALLIVETLVELRRLAGLIPGTSA